MPADSDKSSDVSRTRLDLERIDDDSQAWTRIAQRLTSQLRVLAHFRSTPAAAAYCEPEDLVQEVLAELLRNVQRFEYRGPGSLLRWAAGFLRHKIADAGRRQSRTPVPESRMPPRPAADASAGMPAGLVDALEASQAGASHVARRSEAEQRIMTVLAELPEHQREVLLLKLYEELTQREIAQQLGLDESTVSVRVRKALEVCARRLASLGP